MSFFEGFFLLGVMMIGVLIPRLLPMGLLANALSEKIFKFGFPLFLSRFYQPCLLRKFL